jgi:fatty acid desaturase
MNRNLLKPDLKIEIKNETQARKYTRLLIAKIAVQLIIIAALLSLAGWSLKLLLVGATVATAWKFGPRLWRKFRTR